MKIDESHIKKNLGSNYLLIISGTAFAVYALGGVVMSMIATMISLFIFAALKESIPDYVRSRSKAALICSAVSAVSMVGCGVAGAFECADYSFVPLTLEEEDKSVPIHPAIVSAVILISLPFIFAVMTVFWDHILNTLKRLFNDFKLSDGITLGVLFIAGTAAIVYSFSKSSVFYRSIDVIYTMDCNTRIHDLTLAYDNPLIRLCHPQNDLRQPLFAHFTLPFMAPISLLMTPFNDNLSVYFTSLQIAQLPFEILTYYILAKLLKLKGVGRAAFMVLCASCYSVMLFVLPIEQYNFAVFYLMLYIYSLNEDDEPQLLPFVGAAGTLLTSGAFIVFMPRKDPIKKFKEWFSECFFMGIKFFGALLLLGRSDLLELLMLATTVYGSYAGVRVSFMTRAKQYIVFFKDMFVSPESVTGIFVTIENIEQYSWQLAIPKTFSIAGIIVLALCLVSFIIHRKDRLSGMSFFWIFFSFLLLLAAGWGTQENGKIIYSSYFSWAVMILLYKLAETVFKKAKLEKLLPYFMIAAAAVMGYVNFGAMREMVGFFIEKYPA